MKKRVASEPGVALGAAELWPAPPALRDRHRSPVTAALARQLQDRAVRVDPRSIERTLPVLVPPVDGALGLHAKLRLAEGWYGRDYCQDTLSIIRLSRSSGPQSP